MFLIDTESKTAIRLEKKSFCELKCILPTIAGYLALLRQERKVNSVFRQ